MYLNSKEQDRRIIFEFLNEEFQEQENSNEKKTHTNKHIVFAGKFNILL